VVDSPDVIVGWGPESGRSPDPILLQHGWVDGWMDGWMDV